MNKKILIFGALTALMLVTITYASAVTTTTQTTRKESPLYKIRTRLAIGEKIQNLKETIKTLFVGKRIFYLPFQLSRTEPSISDLRATNKFRDTCYYTGAGGCPCHIINSDLSARNRLQQKCGNELTAQPTCSNLGLTSCGGSEPTFCEYTCR